MNKYLLLPFIALLLTSVACCGDRHKEYHNFTYTHEEWVKGQWFYGDRDGHIGWWWHVNTVWYFYERPVYPYPPEIHTSVESVTIEA